VRRLRVLLPTAAALALAGPATMGAGADVSSPVSAPIVVHPRLENPAGLPVSAVIAGGQLRVVGTVRPFAAGQVVLVRTFRRGVELEARSAEVRSGGSGVGHFTALIGVGGRPATVEVRVSVPATAVQGEVDLPSLGVQVVRPRVAPGQSGAAVRLLQQELAALHYAVPRSGRYDDATARAVIALRKLTNLARTAEANTVVFQRLAAGAGAFRVRYPGQGAHFEGDLTHQVLAEILPGGRVRQIFEMSSGKPSTPTVIGNFRIYLKTFGVNEKGMVDSNYFVGGYAIHGYPDVPTYPASHGCLRIPIPNAAGVYAWAQFGYPVDVYYRSGGGSHRVMGNAGP
jgi:lipoprotein-anchoring transpeptidase ErfK/SrfK